MAISRLNPGDNCLITASTSPTWVISNDVLYVKPIFFLWLRRYFKDKIIVSSVSDLHKKGYLLLCSPHSRRYTSLGYEDYYIKPEYISIFKENIFHVTSYNLYQMNSPYARSIGDVVYSSEETCQRIKQRMDVLNIKTKRIKNASGITLIGCNAVCYRYSLFDKLINSRYESKHIKWSEQEENEGFTPELLLQRMRSDIAFFNRSLLDEKNNWISQTTPRVLEALKEHHLTLTVEDREEYMQEIYDYRIYTVENNNMRAIDNLSTKIKNQRHHLELVQLIG